MNGRAWPRETIESLISCGAITEHKDGNYGSLYPKVEEFGSVGVPFLTAKSIVGGTLDIKGAPRLADARANALRFGFVRPGDVLLSHNATIGRVAIVPDFDGRMLVGTSLTYFRLNPERLSARYFAAYLASADFQNQLNGVMSHSTRNQVPISAQRKLSVVVPPLSTQDAIASISGALDDKIEHNQRTAQALERFAQAIFRAWFVDFEPAKAKAAGATAFPSMPQPVFEALRARLVDSIVGPIPCEWEVSTVGDCTSYLSRGIAPRYVEESGVLVLNQKCIRDFAIDYGKGRRHDTSPRGIEGREVKVGDVLINSTGVGTLGRLAQVLHLPEPAIVDTHVTVVRPSARLNASYFGQALTFMQPYIESLGEGSTGQTELKRGKLTELRLLVPTKRLLDAFEDLAAPLMKLVSQTRLENQSLATLRDYLLPKLLSDGVRVRSSSPSGGGVSA